MVILYWIVVLLFSGLIICAMNIAEIIDENKEE